MGNNTNGHTFHVSQRRQSLYYGLVLHSKLSYSITYGSIHICIFVVRCALRNIEANHCFENHFWEKNIVKWTQPGTLFHGAITSPSLTHRIYSHQNGTMRYIVCIHPSGRVRDRCPPLSPLTQSRSQNLRLPTNQKSHD